MIHWRSITSNNTAQEKDLQNTPLRAVRSMRSVFCRTLPQKIVLLATAGSADFDHGPTKPPQRRSSRGVGS